MEEDGLGFPDLLRGFPVARVVRLGRCQFRTNGGGVIGEVALLLPVSVEVEVGADRREAGELGGRGLGVLEQVAALVRGQQPVDCAGELVAQALVVVAEAQ